MTKTFALPQNLAGLLCYVPVAGIGVIASLLWLFTEPPENKFLRFHAIQSLLLLVAAAAGMFGVGCLGSIVLFGAQLAAQLSDTPAVAAFAVLGFWLAELLYALGVVAAFIASAVSAWRGNTWQVPWLGRFARERA